jgi:hypothetical protein
MVDKDKMAGVFTAQLYDIRTKRDGGGRMALDFGADSLEAVQFIQKLAAKGEVNFQVAMVLLPPYQPSYRPEEETKEYEEYDSDEHEPS